MRTRRNITITAVVAMTLSVGALILLALAVPDGPSMIDRLDPLLRSGLPSGVQPFVDAWNVVGSLPVWLALVGIEALFALRRRVGLAVAIVFASLAAEAACTVVRVLVDRPRPAGSTATELLVASGFPSGHVTRTVVLVAAFVLISGFFGRHRITWVVLGGLTVALMAISRIDASAHYASDTLGGVLLGAAVVAVWSLFVREPEPLPRRAAFASAA